MKKHLNKIIFLLIISLAIFLRMYKIDTLLSPYWEEVALGYDAYSISETMNDHHGNFMPLVAFESFGDWKPSLYFYAIVPFIKIFGLEILAVRLPSAIAGLMIVIGVYALLKLILPPYLKKTKPHLPLLGMFITAISPWAIMFSRAGWEVNFATGLILWGVIFFIKFIQNTKNVFSQYLNLTLSILMLVLSMYTYHATRMIAPLLGLSLVWIWFAQTSRSKRLFKSLTKFIYHNLKIILFAGVLAVFLSAPILMSLTDKKTSQRFAETSIFSNLDIIEESNTAKETNPGIITTIFYHRYVLYGREIFTNYLDHFTLDFLFLSGDENPRHSIQYFGQLYHVELIYLLLGTYFVLSTLRKVKNDKYDDKFKNNLWLLVIWLFVSIIPASLTKTTPHSLRILPALPVFMILITFGISQFVEETINVLSKLNLRHKYLKHLIFKSIILIYILELVVFWRFYTLIYPVQYSSEWQHGYAQMIDTIKDDIGSDTSIYITREQGRPAMYLWFYSKTNPRLIQEINDEVKKDQGEYLEFKNVKFINSFNEVTSHPAILVGSPHAIDSYSDINHPLTTMDNIDNLEGVTIWNISNTL